jgi:dUTP pyrophosphatase
MPTDQSKILVCLSVDVQTLFKKYQYDCSNGKSRVIPQNSSSYGTLAITYRFYDGRDPFPGGDCCIEIPSSYDNSTLETIAFENRDKLLNSFIKLAEHSGWPSCYLLNDKHLTIWWKKLRLPIFEYLNNKYDPLSPLLINELIYGYNVWFLKKNTKIGLLMQINDKELEKLYKFDENGQICSGENCGINLLIPSDLTVSRNERSAAIDYQVCAESNPDHGYLIMPRSSIAKTSQDTLRQSNCLGLIDPGYRGHLIAKVDNLSDVEIKKKRGESISQLVMFDFKTNWRIQLVPKLGHSSRGTGGFGSTGK